MSGYLEVKYPFRSNLGLNPFKTWKRQWCILRPSGTCSGGSLAVYCSEAGAAAGAVELPAGGVVRRAKSRSRAHAFAVFSAAEPHKPRVLLAAPSPHDAQLWMNKIRALLDGRQGLGTELLKESYSVTIVTSELSRKLGLSGDGLLSLSSAGLRISRPQKPDTLVEWRHLKHTAQITDSDKNKICVLTIHSGFHRGGCLKLSTPLAGALATALRGAGGGGARAERLSRSEGDLRRAAASPHLGAGRRGSWAAGAAPDVTRDDSALLLPKESKRIPSGQLSRCAGAGRVPPATSTTVATSKTTAKSTTVAKSTVSSKSTTIATSTKVVEPPGQTLSAPSAAPAPAHARLLAAATIDDCMSDRRSLLSIASGIYEEIPEPPEQHTTMARDEVDSPRNLNSETKSSVKCGTRCSVKCETRCSVKCDTRCSVKCGTRCSVNQWCEWEEPTYESVAECVYATMRRSKRCPPPPLPPRLPFGTSKLGASWNSRMNGAPDADVARHGSLGALPRCNSLGAAPDHKTKTLPKATRQAFSVFRKRLKSDSRLVPPKTADPADPAKENKDVETKKKKFDFTPTRDLFRNFKVGRKMKNLKIAPGNLSKAGETKSCEFLDETEHVTAARCSKSVECLEGSEKFLDEFDGNLSLEFNDDAVAALALPQEIVELILRGQHLDNVRLQSNLGENDYMPMSPIAPPAPIEHHYMAMSPRTNIA